MTLNQLSYLEEISVRSLNVCEVNGLLDLDSMISYYQENKTFTNLKNCGRKSDEELTAICLKYIDKGNVEYSELVNKENKIIILISSLTRTQIEVINSFIETNSILLSKRSKNAITSFLNGNLKISNICDKILAIERFNIQEIKNVGEKSVLELKHFIDSIIEFIEKVAIVKNENDLIILKNSFFIEKTFSINTIPYEILETQSIFRLVDFLINNDAIYEKKENAVFRKGLKIYNNQVEASLEEISLDIDVSKERARQLRVKCLEDLFVNFQFVKQMEDNLYEKYNIDQNQNIIFVDDVLNKLINDTNNTNFSKEFNSIIIYSFISDNYDLVGELDDVLVPRYFNSKERHNWENFYLVKKNISYLLNFNSFVDDIRRRMDARIDKSYNFNFNSYLFSFLDTINLNEINNVSKVAENILFYEFGISINANHTILFNRNSQKKSYEYAFEALKIIGIPSKVNDITKKIKELYPFYETDSAKVRVSMKRKYGFVPIGRQSVFGLKEWEFELMNFKGGTIREIVKDYLTKNSTPQKIRDISNYVLKFRPGSSENSIISNIKLDESKIFVFFKDSFIGLSSKIYDESFILLNSTNLPVKKLWEERFTELKEFAASNNRIPFSAGCPEEEIKLYRWYKVQCRKKINGKLEADKYTLISEVMKNFQKSNSGRKRRVFIGRYNYFYDELINFIKDKKRMPNSRNPEEMSLYFFYYKIKKNFVNNIYKTNQELQLVEMVNELKYSKQLKVG
jgi:hypothetical protein